jgi:polyhydroxyalkanoate synthesis regulator phasin
MATNDTWKRYLETGSAFVSLTQQRAEGIVKDLVKRGEVRQERAQKAVDDLVRRSRKNSEELMKVVRSEVQQQLGALGLATKADIARLEDKINRATASGGSSGATRTAAAKKTTASKTSTAKKAGTSKA